MAFEEVPTAARAWAAVHGHLLPPTTAVWDGYPVGTWTKNQRFAARAADTNAERREVGLAVESSAGALTEARRAALDEIDPGWCPVWDTDGNAASGSPRTSCKTAGPCRWRSAR
ncbi:helicase associated domain-containing protein [Streptomyces sp. NPDC056638]|uniref:helicase associated domain-containing protein n=1 Tax=Streptomyces sp. NPDC056638 TaxID=3345887 RepID=UPI0036987D30